ncbi:hypothetical protein Hanom_Chr12g01097851 [Helianthus anomalus]
MFGCGLASFCQLDNYSPRAPSATLGRHGEGALSTLRQHANASPFFSTNQTSSLFFYFAY